MSWFWKSLKGIIDPQASGESIIERSESNYRETERMSPGAEPHQILICVYLARVPNGGGTEDDRQCAALAKTFNYSCLPFPINIRALAVEFIKLERPDILNQFPQFADKLSEYMMPVQEARKNARQGELYKKYNPKMFAAMSQMILDSLSKE